MTIIMTGGMLFIHSGFCDRFFELWFNDFIIGCCIPIPTGFIIVPIVEKLFAPNQRN